MSNREEKKNFIDEFSKIMDKIWQSDDYERIKELKRIRRENINNRKVFVFDWFYNESGHRHNTYITLSFTLKNMSVNTYSYRSHCFEYRTYNLTESEYLYLLRKYTGYGYD